MASIITACAAVVANLAWAQLSMVSQDCPPDIIVEKLNLPVAVAPAEAEIITKIIPAAETPKCRKGEKQWRTLKNGHRKYRLRRTC